MRFHFMDSMRSVLMALGVLLHAANIYSLNHAWIVREEQGSVGFDVLGESIHAFRMPAFFVIAGFFAALTLKKYGKRVFCYQRIKRLAIPLLSTAVFVNTVQAYLRYRFQAGSEADFGSFLTHELPRAFSEGELVQHLWFLNVVLLYCLACPLLISVMRTISQLPSLWWKRAFAWLRQDCRFIYLLPLTGLIWAAVEHQFPWLVETNYLYGFIPLSEIADYFPFFCGGLLLEADAELLNEFCTLRLRHWNILLFAIWAVLLCSLSHHALLHKVVAIYAARLLNWTSLRICFGLFHRYLNRPSNKFSYLADASYSIYLFHHIVVVALGLSLLSVPIPAIAKFGIIVLVTYAVTLAMHHFVVRTTPVARLLFNGK